MMPRVLLAHPGTPPHAQQAALAYHEQGLLDAYCTTFAYLPDRPLGKALTRVLGVVGKRQQLTRRGVLSPLHEFVRTRPRYEMLRTALTTLRSRSWADLAWEATELDFDRAVSRRDLGAIQVIHGYEHSSLQTFEAGRRTGKFLVLEVVAPHYRLLDATLEKEVQTWPSLHTPQSDALATRAGRRRQRQDREYDLADLIICNSDLTKSSLAEAGVESSKIVAIPLGMPRPSAVQGPNPKKFRFLFAGTVSVRKGAHILLEAWKRLGAPENCELRIVGRRDIPAHLFERLSGDVQIVDSVPRDAIWSEYAAASVLMLPTLLDGFGMVITEALSSGLPVITTDRAGAASMVSPGETGILVQAGEVDSLVSAMRWCLENRQRVAHMRSNCRRAAEGWQWCDYRHRLVREVRKRVA